MRVYTNVDEQTLSTIDELSNKRGISKGEFLKRALDQYLLPDDQNGSEMLKLQSEYDQLKLQYDQAQIEMRHFNDTLKMKDSEIEFLRSTIHQLSDKLPKALPQLTDEEKAEIKKKHWWKFW
jgi:predicted  nucleic acid-binding Zn-ribbon protein